MFKCVGLLISMKSLICKYRKYLNLISNSLRTCLVDCNRHCNVIVIPMVYLFFSLVMFLLQRIVFPYEYLFFKMKNNYSSLKGCISYSLVSVIISKLNIFSNKQTFHINLTIIKIKNHKK